MTTASTTTRQGNTVTFETTSYGSWANVDFEVNGGYSRKASASTDKVEILKWVLRQLEAAQRAYGYLECSPYGDDGCGEMRAAAFMKKGFRPIGGNTYAWGNSSLKREDDWGDLVGAAMASLSSPAQPKTQHMCLSEEPPATWGEVDASYWEYHFG